MASYSLVGSEGAGVKTEASGNAVSTKDQDLGDLSFSQSDLMN
jgi:hypothetical protein